MFDGVEGGGSALHEHCTRSCGLRRTLTPSHPNIQIDMPALLCSRPYHPSHLRHATDKPSPPTALAGSLAGQRALEGSRVQAAARGSQLRR